MAEINNDNKIIDLQEVIDFCEKFQNAEVSQEEFSQWVQDNIKVVSYLPLSDKVLCVVDLLYAKDIDSSESVEWEIASLEQRKFWDVLIKYTNINISDSEGYQTMVVYDMLYSLIGDWILLHCLADYDRTIKMFESVINVYNIQNLLSIFDSFDDSNLQKPVEDFKKTTDELLSKEDLLHSLSQILK